MEKIAESTISLGSYPFNNMASATLGGKIVDGTGFLLGQDKALFKVPDSLSSSKIGDIELLRINVVEKGAE
jgi:hypothetical protein